MKSYMVRLIVDNTEETEAQLKEAGMTVTYNAVIIPNFVTIESELPLADIRNHPLVSRASEAATGNVNV